MVSTVGSIYISERETNLEMLNVDNVKPHDGCVQSDISLADSTAKVVWSILDLREVFLHPIKRLEELHNCFLIRFLRSGEPRAIYAVVDIVVGPLIGHLDFLLQGLREEIYTLVLLRQKIVKL